MLASEIQLLISSIGWALIHFMWQGTLITLAYWVITRSVESIQIKYWTGMGLVLLSLIAPIININSGSVAATSEELLTPLSSTIISHQQLGIEGLFFYFINASLPFIVITWALTVAFLSIRLIRSWLQLAAIKHQCEPQISNELKQYIKNIAIKLDLPVIPLLKISKQVMVPAAYGVLKPTILLPLSLLSQIPRNQLEAIIKHELCHLKRNDFIHNIIQLFADIVLFFHPGIRWMNNDIRHVREQCCDQMVLSHDTETLTYAKALTNIAAYTNGINLKHSVHLGINDGMLLNRVKFLLQNKSSQSSLMVFLPFLLFIFFAIILLQPGQSILEQPGLTTSSSEQQYLTDDSQRYSPQQKRMGDQQFYPKLNVSNDERSNMTSVAENTGSNFDPLITHPNITNNSSNKNQLQLELAKDMQLHNNIETNVLPNELTPYNPVINNFEQSPEVDSVVSDLNMNISVSPTKNNDASITSLASFSTVDSIRPKFKNYSAPEYPESFWYKQIEQDVIATFKIRSNGRAYDINLSSQYNNFAAFEQSVEKAIKRWRFDASSLNSSTLQRTYQQIFSFNISEEIMRNCELKTTGTRLKRPMPCNKKQ